MASRPANTTKRARDMPIYKRYYDLIANGTKTIEVRVAYTSVLRIKPGSQIRFTCRDEATLTRPSSCGPSGTSSPRRRSPWACWLSRSRRCDPVADDTGSARPRRILTVCKGNHCRAPLAAAVLARHDGSVVKTRSAGLRDWHVGKPAHPVMVQIAARCGYDLSGHRGVQVDPELLDWADLVLAMDTGVLAALRELADESNVPKLRLYLDGREVPDPWNQPDEAFTACVTVIEAGAGLHLATAA
jgi:low molecular weight protein-tyrosine phosphatase